MNDFDHSPPTPGCIAAIIPAAGSGQRFGSEQNKLFADLAGKPLWYHSAARLRQQSLIGRIVMPVSQTDHEVFTGKFAKWVSELEIEIVLGGDQRTDSVLAGLDKLAGDEKTRFVAVHDAARPLVSQSDLAAVFAIASQNGAAILAMPMSGTVKRDSQTGSTSVKTPVASPPVIKTTVNRSDLWIALTPQVFRIDLLQNAYKKYRGRPATDDAELVERTGHPVSLVRGSAENIKITHPEDLLIAHAILTKQNEHA